MEGTLREKLQQKAKLLFPATFAHSIEEIASINILFPKKKLKHLLFLCVLFVSYFSYIIDGLLFAFIDTPFLPLPRKAFGPLNYVAHLLFGLVFTELCSTRLYITLLHLKKGKDRIRWYAFAKSISKHDYPKTFAVSQFAFLELYTTAPILYLTNSLVKLLYERCLLIDLLVNVLWMLDTCFLVRYTLMDMPFLYMTACTCYLRVKSKFQDFIFLVQRTKETPDHSPIGQIQHEYKQLIQTVSDVNQLIKLLMLQNNLLIVPFLSTIIVISISQTHNAVQLIIKWSIFVPASVYALRGIILTAVLANIDFKSKNLYKEIASSITRGHVKHINSKRRLQWMMEDLSCNRNQLLMREYTGKVTQMDVCESLIGVMQFTMLLIEFSRQFSSSSII